MQGFSAILGQPNAVNILKSGIESGRVAHAYLFAGPAGLGKKLTALTFARALNCQSEVKPCDSCVSCQKAIHSNHPDIVHLKPEGLSFKIEQARELQKMVHSRVYEGNYKVFIIEDMHKATLQASNSLLKTLEEPPGNSVFVLISENPNALPQTVLSRCQRVNFAPLPGEVIQDCLVKRGYDSIKACQAAELSLGSLGRGLEIIENEKFLKNRQQALEFLQVSINRNYFHLFKVIEAIDKDKTETRLLLEQMLFILRDLCIEDLYKQQNQKYNKLDLEVKLELSDDIARKAIDLVIWASDLAKGQTNSKLLLDVLGNRLGRLA
jgi:DNA polymerase III subunit delta'